MDKQLQDDFADIAEMFAQNRRANYERALREWEGQQNAEMVMEFRHRLQAMADRVCAYEKVMREREAVLRRRVVWCAATAACLLFWMLIGVLYVGSR